MAADILSTSDNAVFATYFSPIGTALLDDFLKALKRNLHFSSDDGVDRILGIDASGTETTDDILDRQIDIPLLDGVEHKTFSVKADYIRKIDYSAPSDASDIKVAKPAKKKAK